MATLIPTRTTHIDDKFGNHYLILQVNHTTGSTNDVIVPDSAQSVAILNGDITSDTIIVQEAATSAGVTIRNQTSGASGVGFDFATDDGVKQVAINTGVATGTYTVIVSCTGSAAGMGANAPTGL